MPARRVAPWVASVACAATCLSAPGVAAQNASFTQEIQQSQRRLQQIREERTRLERELSDTRNQVRDASRDLANHGRYGDDARQRQVDDGELCRQRALDQAAGEENPP